MQKEDIIQFTAVISSKMVTFWDTDLDELAILNWFEALNVGSPNCTISDVNQAFVRWSASASGEFKPKPANIIDLLPNARRSTAAWFAAEKAVRLIGRRRSVYFEDPMITSVILNFGGWTQFCGLLDDPEQQRFVKREFESVYSKSTSVDQTLLGAHEIYNKRLENPTQVKNQSVKIKCNYAIAAPINVMMIEV